MLLAVAEDDVEKFEKASIEIGLDTILNHTFEHGMNVLNLAIDQESEQIIQLLSLRLRNSKSILKQLIENRYGKLGIMAIH